MYRSTPTADSYRDKFASAGLETSSNSTILVMCFDRLDRDLISAREGLAADDFERVNTHLGHAQDLLGELALMVDFDAWEHSGSLVAIYDYLLRLLAVANMEKADQLVVEAQGIVTEIGDAFRTAAAELTAPASSSTTASTMSAPEHTDEPPTGDAPRLSLRA